MGDYDKSIVTTVPPRTAIGAVLSSFIKQRAEDHDKKRSNLDREGKDIRDIVTKSTKKYEKSPEAKEREKKAEQVLMRGTLTVPKGAEVLKVRNPGLKGVLKSDVTLYAKDPSQGTSTNTEAKKGSKVILHSTPNASISFIEVYEVEKTPEGEDDPMKYKIKAKGFAFGSKVKLGQNFVKTDKPLFEKEPGLDDIKQGSIGDCYLLAGLGSIVSKDPGVIKRAILDNGDGTVTVRLFDNKGDKTKPKFEEKFITFEKSVLESDDGDHAKDSTWVQMLEKAYAIHGASKDKSASYVELNAGGASSDVFEAFLGRAGEQKRIPGSIKSFQNVEGSINNSLPFFEVSEQDVAQIKSGLKKSGVSKEVIGKILAEFNGKTFADENATKFAINNLWSSIKDDESIKGKVTSNDIKGLVSLSKHPDRVKFEAFKESYADLMKGGAVRAEDVEKLMKSSEFKALPAAAQQTFRTESKGKFGGKRGTGEYTDDDEAAWKMVEDGLKNEGCIAMGTKDTVGRSQTKEGKSAGEPVSKGMVGKHAYSVTGIHVPEKGDDLFVPGSTKPVKYVRIRNPWGEGEPPGKKSAGDKHGRTYEIEINPETGEFIKMTASPTHKGEFFLELSDLTKRCDTLYTTPPIVSDEKKLTDQITELTAKTDLDPAALDKIARGILYEEGMEAAMEWVKKEIKAKTG